MELIEQIEKETGVATNVSEVNMAKSIIESYIGKLESELDANDLVWFVKCIGYQVAYLKANSDIFTNGYKQVRQDDSTVVFNQNYALSPLVVQTAKNFSFRASIRQISFVPFLAGR